MANCIKDQDKVKFINSVIEMVDDEEILYLIEDLYVGKKDDILANLLGNERISNIAVKRVNAPFFYEMLEELHLGDELKNKRENELRNIIANYQDYDVIDVKNAYCDLYFHDVLKNPLT